MKPSWRTRAPDSDAIWLCFFLLMGSGSGSGEIGAKFMERDEVELHSGGSTHTADLKTKQKTHTADLQPGYFGPEHRDS